MKNIEQELKLALTRSEYEKLLSVGATQPQLQTNFYFACANMLSDTLMRVRVKDGEYTFCYKKLLSNTDGVNVCDEREYKLDEASAKRLIANGLTANQLKRFVNVDVCETYFCLGSLETYRAKFVMDKWMIELDRNEYLGVTDYELECECDDLSLLGQLKEYLNGRFCITVKPSVAKSARFFAKYFKDVKLT